MKVVKNVVAAGFFYKNDQENGFGMQFDGPAADKFVATCTECLKKLLKDVPNKKKLGRELKGQLTSIVNTPRELRTEAEEILTAMNIYHLTVLKKIRNDEYNGTAFMYEG